MINLWNRLLARLAAREIRIVSRRNTRRRSARSALATQVLESRALLSAAVVTDLQDYSPGQIAQISAWNTADTDAADFDWAQAVKFQVIRTDGIEDFPSGNLPWYVTDGVGGFDGYYVDGDSDGDDDYGVFPDTDGAADGKIGTTWFVEKQYGDSTLRLIASQAADDSSGFGGAIASHDFTDSASLTAPTFVSGPGTATAWGFNAFNGDSFVFNYSLTADTTVSGQTVYTTSTTTVTGSLQNASGTIILPVYSETFTGFGTFGGNRTATIPLNQNLLFGNNCKFVLVATQSGATLNNNNGNTGTNSNTATRTQNNAVNLLASASTTTSVSAPSAVYGSNATFTATVSGTPSVGTVQFYVGNTVATGTPIGSPVNVTGGTATLNINPNLAVGNYTIWGDYSGGGGFQASFGSTAFSVTPKAVTLTADNKSKTYGAANPTLTATPAGLVGSDTLNFTLATTATAASGVGTYPIAITLGANPNYNVTATNGTLTVTKAALSVTANNVSKIYDAVGFSGGNGVTFSGFVNGENSGVLGGTLTYSGTSQGAVNVGPSYVITPGGLTSNNYAFTYNNGTLAIAKATLTVDVTGYTGGTYDTDAHTQTVTVTGVGSDGELFTDSLTETNAGSYSQAWSYSNSNYEDVSGTLAFTIDKADATVVVTGFTGGDYDTFAKTQTVTITGVGSDGVLYTNSLTGTNAGSYTKGWSYVNSNYNINPSSGTLAFVITPRDANVAYIGSTYWVTSGSSATAAQVTLSASLQDPTGVGLVGALVSFFDVTSGTPKLLVGNVPVAQVAGNPSTGTASRTVTLSTGQYGAQSYLIKTVVTGNYTNVDQPLDDKSVTISVVTPAGVNSIRGAGKLARLSTAVGTYAPNDEATFSVGLNYNKSLTNVQGNIQLFLPQADGSTIYIKSNSIASMAAVNLSVGRVTTVQAKASIQRILADDTVVTLEGNVNLRFDVVGTGTTARVGFTILSGSTLRYSNNWIYDTTARAWKTDFQGLVTGSGGIAVG